MHYIKDTIYSLLDQKILVHINIIYCHDLGVCDYRQGMDWWMDLLTTYIHHLELQVITAISLISILYKSQQHPLNLLPACCVFSSHFLAMAFHSGKSSTSYTHVVTVQQNHTTGHLSTANSTIVLSLLGLPCRAQLNWQPSNNWVLDWRPFHRLTFN
jgi:hypothetical protein